MLAGRPREPKRCPTDARREAQGARICPEIGCVDRAWIGFGRKFQFSYKSIHKMRKFQSWIVRGSAWIGFG
jgi:hypothetical protein